jgi:gamma-glutamyltranspeptidase/glutathione hydrolase
MYSQYGEKQTKSTVGGLAVGVPGEMRAWKLLHERHGRLEWKRLFQGAIDLARNGFPVNYDHAGFLAGRDWILKDPYWSRSYAPEGTLLKEGDTVYRKDLADTLERLSLEGAEIFYQDSDIADNIIKAVQNAGGIMTHEDLKGYQPILRNASTISYRYVPVLSPADMQGQAHFLHYGPKLWRDCALYTQDFRGIWWWCPGH